MGSHHEGLSLHLSGNIVQDRQTRAPRPHITRISTAHGANVSNCHCRGLQFVDALEDAQLQQVQARCLVHFPVAPSCCILGLFVGPGHGVSAQYTRRLISDSGADHGDEATVLRKPWGLLQCPTSDCEHFGAGQEICQPLSLGDTKLCLPSSVRPSGSGPISSHPITTCARTHAKNEVCCSLSLSLSVSLSAHISCVARICQTCFGACPHGRRGTEADCSVSAPLTLTNRCHGVLVAVSVLLRDGADVPRGAGAVFVSTCIRN